MQGGREHALAHRVHVNDVDARFDADDIDVVQVADGSGDELIEVALAAEAQVLHGDARDPRSDRRPDPCWFLRLRAVADGTAVVHPNAVASPQGAACTVAPSSTTSERNST